MRIVILGPGALGSVLGAALIEAGHDVVLLGRASPHLAALREKGLSLTTRDGRNRRIRVSVTENPAAAAGAEAIIVLVKAGDTEDAASAIEPYVESGQSVLSLQNGLGNAERIRRLLGSRRGVLPGTTSQAAMRLAPGEVVHSGEGPTLIGYEDADDAHLAARLAEVLSSAGWPSAATPDIERWLWRKVAVNAAINGISALASVPNGTIIADSELLASAVTIAEEAASVARARGIELGGMREAVWDTAVATADNRSSMLQDIDAGRRSEVDAIHGAILTAGEASGIDTPAIRLTAALIKAKERQFERAEERDD